MRQDIHRGGIGLSLSTFLHWRWELSGRYQYTGYSDDNAAHELSFASDYLVYAGRNQLRAKVDGNFSSFDQQTQFGIVPGDLLGIEHPYFSPDGFGYATAGLEFRRWLSPHNFRGADEHWYSLDGGARVDSDGEPYGLVQLRGHHDWNRWANADHRHRMNATSDWHSFSSRSSPSTTLKNATVSSSVNNRPSCR